MTDSTFCNTSSKNYLCHGVIQCNSCFTIYSYSTHINVLPMDVVSTIFGLERKNLIFSYLLCIESRFVDQQLLGPGEAI